MTSSDEDQLERALARTDLMELNHRALTSEHLTFERLHRAMPNASGASRLATFEAMPPTDQETVWRDLGQRRRDQHWLNGHVTFERESARERRHRQASQPKRKLGKIDLEQTLDRIRQIPAEDYLEELAGVEPRRGVVQCPLPDHEDRNPSASYRDSAWYCHRCAEGGDLVNLASRISEIPDRGRDFYRLILWIAERVHVDIDRERIEAALK